MYKTLKVLPLAILSLTIAACSSTKLDDANNVASVEAQNAQGYDPIDDPKTPVFGKRSIFFQFDSYSIAPEYASTISAHAAYIKGSQNHKVYVILQGNTDDRGTAEYNLALGQRRSESVKRALLSQGVSESQLEAVSFGKEKPINTAQNEAAFKENRRVDFVYQ